jgi:2,4-dienoyl-CoA reductase-like NADH-dependent reductase (Old Yellow Enzyme family)
VGLAPLTNLQSRPDGTLGEDELRWLERRARGGFQWLSTCAAYVSEQGRAWRGQLGAASEAHQQGLSRLGVALRQWSVLPILQLYHGGARATLAPERVSTGGPEGARAATEVELAQVVVDYAAPARRAERARFAGVEIHGANGYLFTQFLAPRDNPRTDRYGGDQAGRARLLREAVRATRAAVSPGFAVGVRLSPVDTWDRRGLALADSLQVARWLVEDGADFIHLSLREAARTPPFEEGEVPVA